jgi:hypothetical protein
LDVDSCSTGIFNPGILKQADKAQNRNDFKAKQ